jgi:hypothetical protein
MIGGLVMNVRREGRKFSGEVRVLTKYKISKFVPCRTNVLYTNSSKNNLE